MKAAADSEAAATASLTEDLSKAKLSTGEQWKDNKEKLKKLKGAFLAAWAVQSSGAEGGD